MSENLERNVAFPVAMVEDVVRVTISAAAPVVLAVSGGIDSMTLLTASARAAPQSVAAVATFNHGTGPAADEAVALVMREADRLGLPVVVGRAPVSVGPTEADWRTARWTFLEGVAHRFDARIATAHHREDQLETVVMRALRHAGARGLAGMYAPSAVVRPLLSLSRATIAAYAHALGVAAIDDPSNRSRAHLRNRVRLDLLPALVTAHPGFDREMLDVAHKAATWRAAFEMLVLEAHPVFAGDVPDVRGAVAAPPLARYDMEILAVVWPVLAARMGITLDWRGTRRLAEFSTKGKVGGTMQLAGAVIVERTPFWFVFRCP